MINTSHQIHLLDARRLTPLEEESVDLVVTSPPYPMIQMWDELFCRFSVEAREALEQERGADAWEAMHRELELCWREVERVVKPGGIVCINIGDATRSIGASFALYSNHARIISSFNALGFTSLPLILWRKPTNAPTKFMGSGMFPGGAYVTLEHEYILVFRKGKKRRFTSDGAKILRRESAYFWEERNRWFSDIWQLPGVRQLIRGSRERSAAFPFELAYRLINMYSVKDDLVLDPFLGTGTTTLAAIAARRHSTGFELDGGLIESFFDRLPGSEPRLNEIVNARLTAHRQFLDEYARRGKTCKHANRFYDFPVVTGQERELRLDFLHALSPDFSQKRITAEYQV